MNRKNWEDERQRLDRMVEMREQIKELGIRYKRAMIKVYELQLDELQLKKNLSRAKQIESLAENDLHEMKEEYFKLFGAKYNE